MRLRITNSGMLGIVMLEGNLEQQNALELKIRLRSALYAAGRVIVNCEGVTAVSAGLPEGALLGLPLIVAS